MSGHSANPIFFNEKIQHWMSRSRGMSDNDSFWPYSHSTSLPPFAPLPQSGRYIFVTSKLILFFVVPGVEDNLAVEKNWKVFIILTQT